MPLSKISGEAMRTRDAGISWPLPEGVDDAALEAQLYPRAPVVTAAAFPEPDFAYIARELTRKHVTRRQLWREYSAQHPNGLKYTAFCARYQRWLATTGAEATLAPAWGFSHWLYVEATATQQSRDWLAAHVNALQTAGCAPKILVPDTTAVRRALRYDPEINPAYRDLVEHYQVAVLPARSRRPRDKA